MDLSKEKVFEIQKYKTYLFKYNYPLIEAVNK